MCPPSPEHEAARLAALRDCDVMDTESEPAFDELTRLAASICQAPIATVCLVDDRRQWNKSMVGTNSRESGRDECFCGYAINNLGPLVVPDATKDPRFKDIPEVLGKPFFRAYAGIPLILQGGHAVGLLCVVDKKPRPFTVEQVDALHVLARQITALLDLRRRTRQHARVEAELRASEERLRSIVESQSEMICRFAPDTTLTFVNQAYCRVFNSTPDRLLGKPFLDFVPVSSHDAIRAHIAALPVAGEPIQVEHEVVRPDGSIGWQRWTDRAVLNRVGQIVEYQSFGTDVTDRKRAELALQLSEGRFREIVESQTEMICRYRADTTVTFANEAYCRRMGKSAQEIIGRPFLDFIPVSEHEKLREHVANLPQSGEPRQYEHAGPRADGTMGWQRWTDRAIVDSAGEIVEYQGFGWDVTDRKLAEIALLKSESKFRSVAEHSPFGLFVTDVNGDCTYANPAYQRISGLSEQQALGKGWASAIHPDDVDRVVHEWYSAAREARDFASDHRFVHPDGRVVHGVVRASAFNNADGVEGFVGTVKDCTDFFLAHESLERANAQLSETNRRLEQRHNELVQLAYAMTHDLQTPVATISGVVNILESQLGTDTSATVAANLARARRAADRLTDMLDSLMLYAKSGGEQLDLRTLNVGDVLREVVQDQFAGELRHIILVERTQDAPVRADRAALERCLVNLLHNAVKFSGSARPDPRVNVSVEVKNGAVRATVKDNGPGIQPDKLEEMFLPFKRGPLTGRGTGLGLSTVRRYVEGFGGRVWLESDGRTGTTANVELPLSPEKLPTRDHSADHPGQRSDTPAPPAVTTLAPRAMRL